jgi:hypothetical protein
MANGGLDRGSAHSSVSDSRMSESFARQLRAIASSTSETLISLSPTSTGRTYRSETINPKPLTPEP